MSFSAMIDEDSFHLIAATLTITLSSSAAFALVKWTRLLIKSGYFLNKALTQMLVWAGWLT